MELVSGGLDWIDQSAFDHVFVNERVTLKRAELGTWRTLFGEVDAKGGIGIDVTIRE